MEAVTEKLGGIGDLGGGLGLPAPSNPVATPDAAESTSPIPFGF